MEQHYEISDKTIALYGMDSRTRIYEEDKSFIIDKPATSIMEESCSYFGSSLDGRKKGTENLIGVSYKAPIIVEESKSLIFFPTTSPRLANCSWIRSDKIDRFYYKNNNLVIEFKNGYQLFVKMSYDMLNNQILRATRLEHVLNDRKNKIATKM